MAGIVQPPTRGHSVPPRHQKVTHTRGASRKGQARKAFHTPRP
jgi:hypothetical protein